jgi:hypothetical protein
VSFAGEALAFALVMVETECVILETRKLEETVRTLKTHRLPYCFCQRSIYSFWGILKALYWMTSSKYLLLGKFDGGCSSASASLII